MEHPCHKHDEHDSNITRREFLGAMGVAAAGLIAAGCQATAQGTAPAATAGATAMATVASNSAKSAGKPVVAIAQAINYDPATIKKQVRSLLDAVGGLKDVVHSGDKVAIKVNLTGGVSAQPLPGVSAIESYVTHPEVVRALGEAVLEAGAKELYIVESVYEDASWSEWGYRDMAKAIGAKLIDLNNTLPYNDFAQVAVPQGAFVYKSFNLNHILQDVNVFMSVP
jgi:uncharacterized protein (DUF362 family)